MGSAAGRVRIISSMRRAAAVLISVNICLFVPACSREPRPASRPAPRAQPATPVPALPTSLPSTTPPDDAYPTAAQIDWQGPAGFPSQVPEPPLELTLPDGDRVLYQVAQDRGPATIRRVGPDGTQRWAVPGADEFIPGAAMVTLGDRLYIAEHGRISSGANLSSFELASGAKVWTLPVQGLGPISHSKYANRVEVAVIHNAIVVFGNESSGRYIEVFAPDGRMLSTRLVPR